MGTSVNGRTADTAPEPVVGQSEHKLSLNSTTPWEESRAPGAHVDPKKSLKRRELPWRFFGSKPSFLPVFMNAAEADFIDEKDLGVISHANQLNKRAYQFHWILRCMLLHSSSLWLNCMENLREPKSPPGIFSQFHHTRRLLSCKCCKITRISLDVWRSIYILKEKIWKKIREKIRRNIPKKWFTFLQCIQDSNR